MRVLMRFETGDDLHPTFGGVAQDWADFAAVLTNFPTFYNLLFYETGGWAADYDVTCDVTGVETSRGRSVLWDSIDAGDFQVELRDQHGIYDPRAIDTPFGPGRRIRSGARVEIDLDTGSGWFPIAVGFVDSWTYDTPAEGSTVARVQVTAADGFAKLAQAVGPVAAAVGAGEKLGARIGRLLDHADWPPSWGDRRLDAGTVALQATTFGGGPTAQPGDTGTDALSEIKTTARTEDGLVFMDRDGAVVAWDGNYRARATLKLRVLGRDAEQFVTSWQEVLDVHDTWQDVLKHDTWQDVMEGGVHPLPGWHPDAGPDAFGVVAVCATTLPIVDHDDDVRNDISLQRANAPTDGSELAVRKTDTTSIRRYGRHTFEDTGLIHTTPSWTATLAARLLARYKDGQPRVEQVAIDMLRHHQHAQVVAQLNYGDQIEVVDYVAANDGFVATTLELQGVAHKIGPTEWITTLRLDQPRASTSRWDVARWDSARWS